MRNRERKQPTFTVVSRLHIHFWIRLLRIFLVLDFILIFAGAGAMLFYAERTIAEVTNGIEDPQILSESSQNLLAVSGVRLVLLEREPTGFTLPAIIRPAFPPQTTTGARTIEYSSEPELSWWQRIQTLSYRLEQSFDDTSYAIVVDLSSIVRIVVPIFLVLFIIQLINTIDSLYSGVGIIRKTLRPISELADKAQRLSAEKGPYTPGEMKALAGVLEGINAARLDTRIEMEDAQDEIRYVATAINGMLDRINQSHQAQARFVSDASHELRTPIAAIQGYANLLDRWGKHDKQALQESIDAIKDEAKNMQELVEQLLFLARSDNHTLPLEKENFDLAELCEVVVKETRMIDEDHLFESDLTSVEVFADSSLIKQALRILVDNAIKYTAPGNRIKISVTRDAGKARLTVQDEGIGIPPEAVPRIFDRFYRADESRARATGGTGLGLSIAMLIVKRHAGQVEVLSRPDIGTRISIVIPEAIKNVQETNTSA